MTDYNDGKWHGWNGGECPVHPETMVECYGGANAGPSSLRSRAKFRQWVHDDANQGIVAFRVTNEHKEPREFWILPALHGGHIVSHVKSNHPEVIHAREVLE